LGGGFIVGALDQFFAQLRHLHDARLEAPLGGGEQYRVGGIPLG